MMMIIILVMSGKWRKIGSPLMELEIVQLLLWLQQCQWHLSRYVTRRTLKNTFPLFESADDYCNGWLQFWIRRARQVDIY